MSEQIKSKEWVFYKPGMKWVKPTDVGGDMISWVENQKRTWDYPDTFTYSPVIPPKPEPEVEWVEDEEMFVPVNPGSPIFNVPDDYMVLYVIVPRNSKGHRAIFDRPKREGE